MHPVPRTLVVAYSNSFGRALRPLQNKESTVGKLFAKHIKLEDAKQFLQRARYAYTPSHNTPTHSVPLLTKIKAWVSVLERLRESTI